MTDAPRLVCRKFGDLCPARRHSTGWFLVGGGRQESISPACASILFAILLSPAPLSRDDLIDALFGHREDGGPLLASNSISVRLNHINKALKVFGWELRQPGHKRGYRFGRLLRPYRRREHVAEMRVSV